MPSHSTSYVTQRYAPVQESPSTPPRPKHQLVLSSSNKKGISPQLPGNSISYSHQFDSGYKNNNPMMDSDDRGRKYYDYNDLAVSQPQNLMDVYNREGYNHKTDTFEEDTQMSPCLEKTSHVLYRE